MSKKLTRLQKAGALVSMAVLVGAWGVAVGSSGLATAVSGTSASVPEVPALALEQPASVQRVSTAINPQAGMAGALSTLSTNGIPSAALYAYHHAETLLADADPQCKLPWNLVAAIGRVESNHGRSEGNALNAEGLMTPGLIGAALTSASSADRPIGPFQFMPDVWQKTAVDADGDGSVNPQDIDDAATAAGIFLCSGDGDLSTEPGARTAVKRYNGTDSYVDLVMKVSASYASGFYSQTPDGYSTSTLLTSRAFDLTLTDEEREEAERDQEEADSAADAAEDEQTNGGSGTNPGTNPGEKPGTNPGEKPGEEPGEEPGGDGGGSAPNPVGDTVKEVTDTVEETVKEVEDTVKEVTDNLNDVVKGVTGQK